MTASFLLRVNFTPVHLSSHLTYVQGVWVFVTLLPSLMVNANQDVSVISPWHAGKVIMPSQQHIISRSRISAISILLTWNYIVYTNSNRYYRINWLFILYKPPYHAAYEEVHIMPIHHNIISSWLGGVFVWLSLWDYFWSAENTIRIQPAEQGTVHTHRPLEHITAPKRTQWFIMLYYLPIHNTLLGKTKYLCTSYISILFMTVVYYQPTNWLADSSTLVFRRDNTVVWSGHIIGAVTL